MAITILNELSIDLDGESPGLIGQSRTLESRKEGLIYFEKRKERSKWKSPKKQS